MSSFSLTRRAESDLRTIALFTEERWGRTQRNVYIKQFDDTFHMLSGSPSIGKACDYIKDGYQKFPHGSHVIFYKQTSTNGIEIIRILHKHMDVASNFENS